MPLSVAKPQLEQDILDAFEEALQMGKDAGQKDDSANIRKQLAANLANAIEAYVKSAQVNITSVVSTVQPGVAVTAVGPAGGVVGATVMPGIAQHVGFGSLQ